MPEIQCHIEPVKGYEFEYAKLTAVIPMAVCIAVQDNEGEDLTITVKREGLLPVLNDIATELERINKLRDIEAIGKTTI